MTDDELTPAQRQRVMEYYLRHIIDVPPFRVWMLDAYKRRVWLPVAVFAYLVWKAVEFSHKHITWRLTRRLLNR